MVVSGTDRPLRRMLARWLQPPPSILDHADGEMDWLGSMTGNAMLGAPVNGKARLFRDVTSFAPVYVVMKSKRSPPLMLASAANPKLRLSGWSIVADSRLGTLAAIIA
jgi:hypothetical protein